MVKPKCRKWLRSPSDFTGVVVPEERSVSSRSPILPACKCEMRHFFFLLEKALKMKVLVHIKGDVNVGTSTVRVIERIVHEHDGEFCSGEVLRLCFEKQDVL